MAIIPSLPVTLQNGTTADATQVMANFNAIVSGVNANAANSGINTNITQLQGLTVPVAPSQGGTGQQILTPNAVLLGEGTSGVNGAAPGAAGTVLTSNGPGVDPSFQTLAAAYPVGSLYFNASSAINPATLLGFGTWAAFAAGRIVIGVGTGTDSNSNTLTVAAGATSGEYTHQLTTTEMPSHTHTDSGHSHTIQGFGSQAAGGPPYMYQTQTAGSHNSNVGTDVGTANIQNTGGGAFHNNIQPYIGVYIWQRTA